MEKGILITTESNSNNNTNDDPTNTNKHIPGPSKHLLFTATEKVVPIQYPIDPYKYTAELDKLLHVEHNALLTHTKTSNFSDLPQWI